MKTKGMLKITAIILSIFTALPLTASALMPNTDALASRLMRNGFTRFFAPVIFAMDEAVEYSDAAAKAKAEAKAEQVDRGHAGYVVSAMQRLNMESGKYYAELTIINETGSFDVLTIDDVENYNFLPVLEDGHIGKISSIEGKFIEFDMKKTDKIQKLEPRRSIVKNTFSAADGFYLVNVIEERNGVLSFYDTDDEVREGEQAKSCSFHEDGYAIIAIDDGEYYGEALARISRSATSLPAGVGNAVIQISEGEILRVFSFESGYRN